MLENIDLKELSFSKVIKTLENKRSALLSIKEEVDKSLSAIEFTINTLTSVKPPEKIIHLPSNEPGLTKRGRKPRFLTPKTKDVVVGRDELLLDGKKFKKRTVNEPEKIQRSGTAYTFKEMAVFLLKEKGPMQPIELTEAIVSRYGADRKRTASNLGVLLPSMVTKSGKLFREKKNGKPYYSLKEND